MRKAQKSQIKVPPKATRKAMHNRAKRSDEESLKNSFDCFLLCSMSLRRTKIRKDQILKDHGINIRYASRDKVKMDGYAAKQNSQPSCAECAAYSA